MLLCSQKIEFAVYGTDLDVLLIFSGEGEKKKYVLLVLGKFDVQKAACTVV